MAGIVDILNRAGEEFCEFAWAMLVQSGALIVLLYLVDLLIRRRVRAVVRYGMWMLVFVKLVLPPTLCLPTGIGYWCGVDTLLRDTQATREAPDAVVEEAEAMGPQHRADNVPPVRVLPERASHRNPLSSRASCTGRSRSKGLARPPRRPCGRSLIAWTRLSPRAGPRSSRLSSCD